MTKPVLRDVFPVFGLEGKYLYLLSYRIFDPVYDNIHFDFGFPRGMKPYVVVLKKGVKDPFSTRTSSLKDEKGNTRKVKVEINFDIKDRIYPFPVKEDIYTSIAVAKKRFSTQLIQWKALERATGFRKCHR